MPGPLRLHHAAGPDTPIARCTRMMGLLIAILVLLGAPFQNANFELLKLAPSEFNWVVGDNGIGRAVITGNSAEPGLYAYRVRFPVGLRIQPHYHPDDRIVTVISGTLHMAYGDRFDESVLERLPTGSLWTEPGGQPHFVWAREGEVIIQVIGNGPSATVEMSPNR
jgi:quercetin dioxygenase-like cupin family protein